MKPYYAPCFTFTMNYDILIMRWSIANKPGLYRVFVGVFLERFIDGFDAVVDDFGNLVRVKA